VKSYYDKRLVALFHHQKMLSLLVSGFQASNKKTEKFQCVLEYFFLFTWMETYKDIHYPNHLFHDF
jgi:hypothetical protein